ncbi:hypothetical protein KAU51_02450 [Candidatus Parcubacteria bacterium]|nr:hypothetical protein [Candidatus Parcubacteria bacterium]
MKNSYKILIVSFIIFSFFGTSSAKALINSDFTNHQAPSSYCYPQEFDKLVMDLTIPSGRNGEDKLLAIALENIGTAKDFYDIERFKLWKDDDTPGFQGLEKDKELGTFTFNGLNNNWYLDNLEELVSLEGLRIFVSVEIWKHATANRSIQLRIPILYDENSNGDFDIGDLGIFMESKNNGPSDEAIVNSYSQTIRDFVIDNLAPKTVITEPENNSIIDTENYTIKGVARDQGGSTPSWVKIGINNVWYEVDSTSSNYGTWEYQWQDITEGDYILKTKSADWLNNTETDGDSITVEVNFPELVIEGCIDSNALNYNPEATRDDGSCEYPPIDEEEEEEEEEEEKPISEMNEQELKAKIKEVQQMIIELLNQLIILIQSQISQL